MAAPLQSGTVSPELVLVDAALAVTARAELGDRPDTLAPLMPDPGAASARHTAEALRRLTALADLDAPAVPRRRSRTAKVVGAFATWSMVSLLLVHTGLLGWSQVL